MILIDFKVICKYNILMLISEFDYELPEELIAQKPTEKREQSKMMVLNKENHIIEHKNFFNIVDYLDENCILILNNTKVMPARLYGYKDTGAKIEIFLLKEKEAKSSLFIIFSTCLKIKIVNMYHIKDINQK